jgi:MFS family permease
MSSESDTTDGSKYKWFILGLSGLTATLVVAMPAMAMPVLFAEMSEDLGLTIVQIGAIWGMGSFAGIFTALLGGTVGDKFGTKRVLVLGCLLVGVAGALRAFSTDFVTLAVTVFVAGLVGSFVPMNLHKTCGVWFSKKRLGLANGAVATGMAFGFMTGSMISATVLSPLLGGWRQVLFFYGIIGVVMSIPWALTRSAPRERKAVAPAATSVSIRRALAHVRRLKNVWLMGLVMLGVGGCVQGMLGYLSLYLQEIGWPAPRADAALAAFHAASLLSVIPLALLSDRLGSRRRFLAVATVMIATGVGLLSVADGLLVWVAVLMAGIVRDGYMAIFFAMVTELDGVGVLYAGTAMGLTQTLSRVGGLIAPPVGNSLATVELRLPFVFWAAMAIFGLVLLRFVKEGKAQEAPVDLAPLVGGEIV